MQNPTLRRRLFWIGFGVILFCFLACVISFYLVYFAWPVYAVASILVLLSDRSLLSKFVAVVLPIVFWWPATSGFILLYGWAKSTPEAFLIPEHGSNTFRIVHDEACGTALMKENGRTTYIIPENGILITAGSGGSGIVDHKYFLVDSVGRRTEVSGTSIGQSPKTYPTVVSTGIGVMSPDTIFFNSEDPRETDIHFSDFWVVRDSSNMRELWEGTDPQLSRRTVAAVRSCRRSTRSLR